MRLDEQLIKQAILHPEKDVRSEAVLYFSRSYTTDDSVLPLAIQAVEKFGWDEAFSVAACMTGLPLNDATLPWVLAQLQHEDAKKPNPYGFPARWHTLNSLLSNADAELLARHKDAVLNVESLEDDTVEVIIDRTDLLTVDAETCWYDLEQYCEEVKDVDDLGDVDLDYAYGLAETIARHKDRYAPRVLDILAETITDLESNPKVWMETFAVRMAGQMRLEPAIPLLIGKLKEEDEEAEWLREQCEIALVKIGGDEVKPAIPILTEMLNDKDQWARCVAATTLGQIGPEAKSAIPVLVEKLKDHMETVGRAAGEALGKMGPEATTAVPAITRLLQTQHHVTAAWALWNVTHDAEKAVPPLLASLKNGNSNAARTLGRIGPEAKAAVPVLTELLTHKEQSTRYNAASALGKIGPEAKAAVPALTDLLKDQSIFNRGAAAEALGKIGPEAKAAKNAMAAADALGRIGPGAKAAIPSLTQWLKTNDSLFRLRVAIALVRINPRAEPATSVLTQFLHDENDSIARDAAAEVLKEIKNR